MADPTLVELTIRLSPAALATLLGLVREQVAVSRDLTEQALHDGDPEAAGVFMFERSAWQEIEGPLVAAVKRVRDRFAAAGVINTRPCPDAHDHNRLQARADEDGFPRVCEGCERRFERIDF